jgi:carbamoyl-phosphate synthase large subunit
MLCFVNFRRIARFSQPGHCERSKPVVAERDAVAPNPFRVLITGGGTTTAVSALKGLRMGGDPSIHVVMGDMTAECAGAHLGNEFVALPSANQDDFRDRIVQLCRERHIDLVIPIIDHEFTAWSDVRPKLAAMGTHVAISSRTALEQCQEKDRTHQLFEKLGVSTIPTWRGDAIDDPRKLPFPVYLKPRCGRASIDNYRADTFEEFQLLLPKVPDAIVQPFTHGTEVTIDCVSDFHGRFLAACPRVRLQVKSGQAYRSKTFRDARLEAYARTITEALPIVGPCNIQCFLTDDGPRFFEINARFGAGSVLSMQAGLNGPLALVAMSRKQPLPSLAARPDVSMLRYWQEVFVENGAATLGGAV